MGSLLVQANRIRRHLALLITITVLAVVGTVAYTLTQATSYRATCALSVFSPEGGDQATQLAQGYVELFNQEPAQEALRAALAVPPDVTLAARTSASSPIVLIEATARDPQEAKVIAQQVAIEFRDNINVALRDDNEEAVKVLRDEIETVRQQFAAEGGVAQDSLIFQQIANLQERIAELRAAGANNELRGLQLEATVASFTPNVVENAILALVGGLVLGVAAALVLSALRGRVSDPSQVRDRLGLDTLAVVSDERHGQRSQELKSLASTVYLGESNRPLTVAVTAPHSTPLSRQVAESLAAYGAQRGERTLLIRADFSNGEAQAEGEQPGLAAFLAGHVRTDALPVATADDRSPLFVLPAGQAPYDPFVLFTPERFMDVLDKAERLAALVIVEAPPVNEAAESQVICAAVDRTLLVVEEDVTKIADAREALERLGRAHVHVLGAVLGRRAKGKRAASIPESAPIPAPVPAPTRADYGPTSAQRPSPAPRNPLAAGGAADHGKARTHDAAKDPDSSLTGPIPRVGLREVASRQGPA